MAAASRSNKGPSDTGLPLPRRLPQALATHCAEEYANLAALLPQLYARWHEAR